MIWNGKEIEEKKRAKQKKKEKKKRAIPRNRKGEGNLTTTKKQKIKENW